MQTSLQTVRDVVREGFGSESFVAGFISQVQPDANCATACINAQGKMLYNPEFANKHLQRRENLFCLLVHELCHCVFRHSVHGHGKLENFGEDSLINAFVTQTFPKVSGKGRLFTEFYPEEGMVGLLRPGSKLVHSRFGPLHARLYASRKGLSSGEVIQTLRVLLPEDELKMPVLLGSHGEDGGVSDAVREGIAEDLANAIDLSDAVGVGGPLCDLFRKRLKSAVGIRRAVLRRYTTNQRLDRFVSVCRETRTGVSPVPIAPTKRELIMMHAGMMPPHFRRPVMADRTSREGLAVYLDVSGSVESHLPRILGVLARLENVLTGIYLFSTKVVEVPFKEVMAGRIQTTFGTSFDCIAESVVEKRFQRAIILTDGYAFLTEDKRNALTASKAKLLTVLFGGARGCDALGQFGEVVQLEDVVG